MEGSKFKEFLEETPDIVHGEKTMRNFKILGQKYFLQITEDLHRLGYTSSECYFNEGVSPLSGMHILSAVNPNNKKGIYLTMGLYFNEGKRASVRALKRDGSAGMTRKIRLIDVCDRSRLVKYLLMIIKEDCKEELGL